MNTNTNVLLQPWSREQAVAYVRAQNDIAQVRIRDNAHAHVPKLRRQDAEAIRALLTSGQMAQVEIAKRYRVSQTVVSRIKRGATWKRAA